MKRNEAVAIGEIMKRRLARPPNISAHVNIPETLQVKAAPVSIVNQVETPEVVVHVKVDMEPVAQAIRGMTAAVAAMSASLAELIGALRNQKQPKVENVVNVPQTTVNVAAPNVEVKIEQPKPQKKKIKFELDDDGNATGATVEVN